MTARAMPGADVCTEAEWRESHTHSEVQDTTQPTLSFCLSHQINAPRFLTSEVDLKEAVSRSSRSETAVTQTQKKSHLAISRPDAESHFAGYT